MTAVQNIIAKLNAANAASALAAAKERLEAEVEAKRAEGPSISYQSREELFRRVYQVIELTNPAMAKKITFTPCKFIIGDPFQNKYDDNKWAQRSHWIAPVLESEFAYFGIIFDVEQTRNYRRGTVGRSYITIGGFTNRKRFKQFKTGEWNFKAIAEDLISRVESGLIRRHKEEQLNLNKNAVAEVKKATEMSEYYAYRVAIGVTSDPTKPVNLKINWSKDMTVDQAIELVNALKKLGIND